MGSPNGDGPVGDGARFGGSTRADAVGDTYRAPLLPGDYPPLGYSPAGVPRYHPADLGSPSPGPASPQTPSTGAPTPTLAEDRPAGPTGLTPPRSVGSPSAGRRFLGLEPGVGVTVGAAAVIGVLLIGLVFWGVGSLLREPTPTVVLPPATITDEPTLPTLPTDPSQPGRPTPSVPGGSVPIGAQVTYRVTIDGTGTILYVDNVGVRTEFAPPPTWTVNFTAGRNPLRLVVVAGGGSSAECAITVDGREVISDRVEAASTRRTASCIA